MGERPQQASEAAQGGESRHAPAAAQKGQRQSEAEPSPSGRQQGARGRHVSGRRAVEQLDCDAHRRDPAASASEPDDELPSLAEVLQMYSRPLGADSAAGLMSPRSDPVVEYDGQAGSGRDDEEGMDD